MDQCNPYRNRTLLPTNIMTEYKSRTLEATTQLTMCLEIVTRLIAGQETSISVAGCTPHLDVQVVLCSYVGAVRPEDGEGARSEH